LQARGPHPAILHVHSPNRMCRRSCDNPCIQFKRPWFIYGRGVGGEGSL